MCLKRVRQPALITAVSCKWVEKNPDYDVKNIESILYPVCCNWLKATLSEWHKNIIIIYLEVGSLKNF